MWNNTLNTFTGVSAYHWNVWQKMVADFNMWIWWQNKILTTKTALVADFSTMRWFWRWTFEHVKRVVFVAHCAAAKDADSNIHCRPGYHDTSGTAWRRVWAANSNMKIAAAPDRGYVTLICTLRNIVMWCSPPAYCLCLQHYTVCCECHHL